MSFQRWWMLPVNQTRINPETKFDRRIAWIHLSYLTFYVDWKSTHTLTWFLHSRTQSVDSHCTELSESHNHVTTQPSSCPINIANVWSTYIDESLDYLFDVKFSSYGGYAASSFKLAELYEKYVYFTSTRFRCLKSGKHFRKKGKWLLMNVLIIVS